MYTVEKLLENICGDKLSKDPDNTTEAREFYAQFWGESPEFYDGVLKRDIGRYRGDSIISFNTIAGCTIRLLSIYCCCHGFDMPEKQKRRLDIIKSAIDLDTTMKEKFQRFYDIYNSRANFMPLIVEDKSHDLNSVIKNVHYNDFPDLFFASIRDYYTNGKKCKEYEAFTHGANGEYFNKFAGWEEFIKQNYLRPFLEDENDIDGAFVQLDLTKDIKMPIGRRAWEKAKTLTVIEKGECMKHISTSLTNAIMIIENRAKLLAMGPVKNITKK